MISAGPRLSGSMCCRFNLSKACNSPRASAASSLCCGHPWGVARVCSVSSAIALGVALLQGRSSAIAAAASILARQGVEAGAQAGQNNRGARLHRGGDNNHLS
eukprot:CAMPEP_0179026296 /NCGR_PEP_ID=MMETSP0796-20121207/8440_1 /TAXON_ID=73915 /ORGANISM="Pyrodinium bahamense, Strain pbaha01" /LENGTH=102 /DNA_ID=CAMNT_0020722369 /DNA_START=482 /DNA_END=787 /DNA_ORIENTATION=+